MLAGGGFPQDLHELPIVMLPGPRHGRPAGRLRAGVSPSWVQELLHAGGQLSMVMGIVNHVAVARGLLEFASAVVAGGNYRETASQRFKNHQGARVVKRRMNQ